MKILHLTSESGWRGGEKQLALLVRNLSSDYRNIICAPPGSEVARRLPDAAPVHPAACKGFLNWRSVLAVRSLLRREKIDVIHAHTSKAQEVALLARVGPGIPVAVSRRVAFPVSGGWKYRHVERFFAVSQAAEQELLKAGIAPTRIDIIHDGVDGPALDGSGSDRANVADAMTMVLCAAAFTAEKDHATLLQAWRQVESDVPNAWLCLAGDGPLRSGTEAQARALNLRRISFLGWRDDIGALMRGADIVALSSRSEGFASTLCEAQWLGKPIAATSAGGIGEAVENGVAGLLSPVADASELAANLVRLCNDPDLRAELGRNGRARAIRDFDPQTYATRHAAAYEALLARPA